MKYAEPECYMKDAEPQCYMKKVFMLYGKSVEATHLYSIEVQRT